MPQDFLQIFQRVKRSKQAARQDDGTEKAPFRRCPRTALLFLAVLLPLLMLISFTLGRYPIAIPTAAKAVVNRCAELLTLQAPFAADWSKNVEIALFNIRLPRLLLGALVGAGLSVAGAAFQSVFRNPMVSPDVLGASGGAGFGAALGILMGLSSAGITMSAFVFGLISIMIVFFLSKRVHLEDTLSLILCGMIVSSLFSASLSLVKLMADPNNELPAITYWLMGSLASARGVSVRFAAPAILGGMLVMFLLRWQLNLMSLGEKQARTLGVHVKAVRAALILSATLVTAASVAVSGMIGWIGLVIPHFSSLLFGADYRWRIPASALLGACFTILVDNASRLIATSEVPLGILTSFFGAPLFMLLLIKEGRR